MLNLTVYDISKWESLKMNQSDVYFKSPYCSDLLDMAHEVMDLKSNPYSTIA